ncbi:hypothetical protein HMP0015_2965 [Acinetobacter haemolyticus ATCC 19194]|uniref:Uncharacterized protein n=1 Tax=Acinetobacter haemolyticus ATCC 19194 TaxID=707232 RepID=D4XTC3_ACIHA|nr:hypothetical protein HMP0015_2965 [Acinetobacter haemolyticus ATCC 19194]
MLIYSNGLILWITTSLSTENVDIFLSFVLLISTVIWGHLEHYGWITI